MSAYWDVAHEQRYVAQVVVHEQAADVDREHVLVLQRVGLVRT